MVPGALPVRGAPVRVPAMVKCFCRTVSLWFLTVSLDVLIMHLPPEDPLHRASVAGPPPVFGTGAQVRALFGRVLPGCRYDDGELRYEGAGFTISSLVDEPDDRPVTAITVVICVDGGDPMPDVLALASALDATAVRR